MYPLSCSGCNYKKQIFFSPTRSYHPIIFQLKHYKFRDFFLDTFWIETLQKSNTAHRTSDCCGQIILSKSLMPGSFYATHESRRDLSKGTKIRGGVVKVIRNCQAVRLKLVTFWPKSEDKQEFWACVKRNILLGNMRCINPEKFKLNHHDLDRSVVTSIKPPSKHPRRFHRSEWSDPGVYSTWYVIYRWERMV